MADVCLYVIFVLCLKNEIHKKIYRHVVINKAIKIIHMNTIYYMYSSKEGNMESDIKSTEEIKDDAEDSSLDILGESNKKKGSWKKIFIGIIVAICIVTVGGISGFYVLRTRGEAGLKAEEHQIVYNGKEYRYKTEIVNILCLGIDKTVPIAHIEMSHGYIGMADAVLLLSIDTKRDVVKIIAIPRDTMAEVQMTDEDGHVVQTEELQICTQYAYGKSMQQSNELTVATVSKLLCNIPIQRCCAINFEAVPVLNDAIGGVDVIVEEDIEDLVPELKYGQKVHLEGELALSFMRARDKKKVDGSVLRMQRQKQYAIAFAEKAKDVLAKNPALPVTVYRELQKEGNMCTDITVEDITYLIPEFFEISFTEDLLQILPGESILGKDKLVEYYIDADSVKEMIMNTFYEEV